MPSALTGYNRENAFAFAGAEPMNGNFGTPSSCGEPPVPETIFGLNDVSEVIAQWEQDDDGWDCVASGAAKVAATRENIIRWGLSINEREKLGLLLPDDSGALK